MNTRNGFSWLDFDELRRTPQATMGIFLTPACPVQCAHCAVDAPAAAAPEPEKPFLRAIGEMSRMPDLVAAAVTGGEPFSERRLLEKVVQMFREAGKRVVVYTSGYWGSAEFGEEFLPVLGNIDGLVFGVDLYHRAHIPDADLIRALRQSADRGVWIAAQVVGADGDPHMDYAAAVFQSAFGPEWESTVQVVRIPPLPSGRASRIDSFKKHPAAEPEFCFSINGPTLLPDGTLAACCNEDVVLRKGPRVFRVEDQGSLSRSLQLLEDRKPLQFLTMLPPSTLLSLADQCLHPGRQTKAGRLCESCWRFVELYGKMKPAQKEKYAAMAAFLTAAEDPIPPEQTLAASAGPAVPVGGGDV